MKKHSTMSHSCMITLIVISTLVWGTKAQIKTACSSSMITSFTPCFNFITGSTGSASSPSRGCCDSLKSLMTDNMDCACLIITGNVPLSIPFVGNLGISLPRACKSSVPLQCTASGVPLPPPGPVLFGPPPSLALAPVPAHAHPRSHAPAIAPAPTPHNRKNSKAKGVVALASPPSDIAPSPKFPLGPSAHPGIRPVLNLPNSAITCIPSYIVLVLLGVVAFNFF